MFLFLLRLALSDPTPTTPWPTSKSGIPPNWLVIATCVGAFAILFLFVTVWMCIKHPDDEKGLVEMPSTYTSAYESVY